MKKSILKAVSIVLCAASLLMTACNGKDNNKNDSLYGGEVVVGVTQEPGIFDPHTVVAAGDKEILFNIFEGLYKFDADGNLNPCLATEVEISDDASVYTFTLREGVKFHDGSDMTASDVVYSLKRAAGILDTQDGTALVAELDGIVSVEENADGKVVVTLDAPNSELLSYFTVAIVPEEVSDLNATPIGTGPFVFESYDIGVSVVLVRNDNYWESSLPYLDKVTFKICADLNSGFLELQNGQIDIFPYLSSDKTEQLDPNQFTTLTLGSDMVQIFALNNDVEPFNDVRVREAINYAINREDIIELTMNGDGVALTTAMSPVIGEWYNSDIDGTYSQDLEHARELLADAGYADGFDMTITVPSNYLVHVNTGVVLADQLSAIGINATIEEVDWATWLSDVYADTNYQSTVICLTSNFAPYDVLNRYATGASGNFINYSNPEFDEIMAMIPVTTDHDQKVEFYHQLLEIMVADSASCYIQDPSNVVAVSNRVTGYRIYPMYVQDMSQVHLVVDEA